MSLKLFSPCHTPHSLLAHPWESAVWGHGLRGPDPSAHGEGDCGHGEERPRESERGEETGRDKGEGDGLAETETESEREKERTQRKGGETGSETEAKRKKNLAWKRHREKSD